MQSPTSDWKGIFVALGKSKAEMGWRLQTNSLLKHKSEWNLRNLPAQLTKGPTVAWALQTLTLAA